MKSKGQHKVSSEGSVKTSMLSTELKSKVKVYMNITYQGGKYKALLDTGCDVSVVSSRILPGLSYQKETRSMFAANLSQVPILGTATVSFSVSGVALRYKFLVSDAVEEIILGSDWLVENRCHWDFESGTLWLKATQEPVKVQLVGTGVRQCVRRIYSRETVELQPGTQNDIAVKSVWSTLPSRATQWIVESKELHPGVVMARTLLSADGGPAQVRVVN